MKKIFFIFFLNLAILIFTNFCYAGSLKFAIFSDCHLQDTKTQSEEIFFKIIEKIKQGQNNLEFVACLGDIIGYPSTIDSSKFIKAVDKYLTTIKQLDIPVYTVPGNHDLEGGEKFEKIFQERIGSLSFTIEKKGFLLIFLNSQDFSQEQINLIKNQLEETSLPKLVFMHKPVFPVFKWKITNLDFNTCTKLKKIFEKNNVIGVFSGHEHIFYTRKIGSITQVISGGSGGKLAPAPEGGKSVYHYCIITVKDKNVVEVEPVIIGGN